MKKNIKKMLKRIKKKLIKKKNNKKNHDESETESDNELEEEESILDNANDDTNDIDSNNNESNYEYPDLNDPNLQLKLYKKREFYYYKTPNRPDLNNYEEIEKYRNKVCNPTESLPHQNLLSNFINPDTPYKGILCFHGTGSGKCVTADTLINVNKVEMEIIAIWNKYKSYQIITENESEICVPNETLYTKSLNVETGIMVDRKINYLYREKVDTTLMKIKLENNFEITKTYSHKLYTNLGWNNNIFIDDNVLCYINNELIYSKVINIIIIQHNDYVYDIEVDDLHNFVGNNIINHNTFVGATIAQKFVPMVQRYGTKIHIIVPGPLLKENWKKDIIKSNKDKYLKKNSGLVYMNEDEQKTQMAAAMTLILQHYRFMSSKGFAKRVLGDRIVNKKSSGETKLKNVYQKNKEGKYEREFTSDRIYDLNNTLLIIDEAHNFTGNSYGEALMSIIKSSINLKVVLLTATPMKNLADDIVELVNYLRPIDSQMSRDKIFTSSNNYEMEFKPNGREYLKKMCRGYISHLRGADPVTFAEKVDMGVKPKGLMFTKLILCNMENLQLNTYKEIIKDLEINFDSLDTKSSAISNFVIPILNEKKNEIIGTCREVGLNLLKNQIKSYYDKLNSLIGTQILGIKNSNEEFVNYDENKQNITGAILKKKYLKNFSVKFHKALEDIEENLFSKNKQESKTGFVYSNLVKSGIEIFQEILLKNGYLEFSENSNSYNITDDTICYYCNTQHGNHKNKDHGFKPATFLTITGKANENDADVLQDKKIKYINDVFNNVKNKNGKDIKLILGSKVMSEGISLHNVGTVHILDAYYNLGRTEQIVGRAIRWCSHYKVMDKNNVYPQVKVFKYVASLGKDASKSKAFEMSSVKKDAFKSFAFDMSAEEDLYAKAEKKFILVKKVERSLKEIAIDCALNQQGNVFKEEIEKYDKCKKPSAEMEKKETTKDDTCPAKCDYMDCNYLCNDKKLINKYYDPERNIYRKLNKMELDYTTFTDEMAKNEIKYAKERIKELYIIGYIYDLKIITEYVYNSYDEEKQELFDDFYVQKALDELLPVSQNDFNNFIDIIYDKTHNAGYLIYVDGYYIFQPFSENENTPIYYRHNFKIDIESKLSLSGYLSFNSEFIDEELKMDYDEDLNKQFVYNFDNVMDYYNHRPEFSVVGIIDKELTGKTNKRVKDIEDVFKLRDKKQKETKRRGTNIQTFRGSVCSNSKTREYLDDIAKKLKIKNLETFTRETLCKEIMDKLFHLEKYSVGKDKKTYLIIPSNHPKYKFPLNLEDRVEYVKLQITELLKDTIIKFNVKNKDDIKYDISFSHKFSKQDNEQVLSYGWSRDNDKYSMIID